MRLRSDALIGAAILAPVALGLLALSGEAGPGAAAPEAISDALCLRKMALDLTYRGPTEAELAELEAGTATLPDFADRFMASPQFDQVVFDWYRRQFPPSDVSPEGTDFGEPARIARHIVFQDLDYRQILTGDFTVAVDGSVSTPQDRPASGVLSTAHYMSANVGSFRRNWAGHFLKEWAGIVLEPVTLPPEAEGSDLSPASILDDPSCNFCHGNEIYGIDHLAPFSFCYDELGAYNPACSPADSAGSFLTVDGSGLRELGAFVADSNEFMSQAVNFFYKNLFGRGIAVEEADFYVAAITDFRTNGYRPKSLIRHIVTSPEYCAR